MKKKKLPKNLCNGTGKILTISMEEIRTGVHYPEVVEDCPGCQKCKKED